MTAKKRKRVDLRRSHAKKTPALELTPAPASRIRAADLEGTGLELPPVAPVSSAPAPATDALAALELAERAATPAGASSPAPLETTPAPAIDPAMRAELTAARNALAKAAALDRMVGVFCSGVFDLVALWTSLDAVRLDDEEERELGELGGPALAPYMGEYSKHAPLFAFGARLATVVTTKVFVVRATKAADAHQAPNGNGNGR